MYYRPKFIFAERIKNVKCLRAFVNLFWIREGDRANRNVRLAPFQSPSRREGSIAYRSRGRVDDRALGESTSILVKGPDYVDPRDPS